MHPMNRNRSGFSLVDLVCVLFCVLIVAAIGCSGLASQRSTVRLVDCATRLRKIALAAHFYHDSFGTIAMHDIGNPCR